MAKKSAQNSPASSNKKSWIKHIVQLLVALFALLGIIITRYGPPAKWLWSSRPSNNIELKITYPIEGSSVSPHETIRGESKNIPVNHEIWVIIYSYPDRAYYPSEKNATPNVNGWWASPETDIGATSDSGQDFDVICVLADQEAQQELRSYAETVERSGMTVLPKSAKEYHRVKVKRTLYSEP